MQELGYVEGQTLAIETRAALQWTNRGTVCPRSVRNGHTIALEHIE
jgi:hypothetical protein